MLRRFLSLVILVSSGVSAMGAQAPAQREPQNGTVAGTVLGAETGQPLGRARVAINRMGERQPALVALTGADGRFLFRDLEPGRYQLRVERNGYVGQSYGQSRTGRGSRQLVLEAGQNVKDLVFRMVRAGVIAGRVFDEMGEPTPYVTVQVLRLNYAQGRRGLQTVGGGATNDLGEYRIFGLTPGKYVVSASYPQGRMGFRGTNATVLRDGSPDEELYAPTYFPGTTDLLRATNIDLKPGQVAGSVDFTLLPSRAIRVRGTVTNSVTGQAAVGAQLWVLPRELGARGLLFRGNATSDESGVFDVRVPTPGSYHVMGSLRDQDRLLAGRVTVEVGSNDVEGISLSMGISTELNGRIRVDGGGSLNYQALRIFLRPREDVPFYGGAPAQIKEDGSFAIANVIEDNYLVSVANLPEDYYLKSIKVGPEEALERGVNVTRGKMAPLELVLSPSGGRVEGLLLGEDGLPTTGTVVLVPNPQRRQIASLYKITTTDQLGRFVLRGVAPGDYKLFAWEEVEPGAWQDADFLGAFESKGVAVQVKESSAHNVEAKQIPAGSVP